MRIPPFAFHCAYYFRELLLLKGIASQGIGNWKKIAEHVGTQTKEEVEKHYNDVYVDSPGWPLPVGFVLYLQLFPLTF